MTLRWTLGIPGNGPSNFVISPVPSLLLDEWTEIPARAPITNRGVARYSHYGTPQVQGPAHQTKYLWTANTVLHEPQTRHLEALYNWQQTEQLPLRLIDETQYLGSEPNPHSRTLLQVIQEEWNPGYVFGYGVFPVWLTLGSDWKKYFGTSAYPGPNPLLPLGGLSNFYTVTFSVQEL